MYCRNCYCDSSICYCGEDEDLVDAHYCENCGTICSEDDLDRNGVCNDCFYSED